MVYELLLEMGVDISVEIGEAVYTGLTTDTGCFQHSSVQPVTHTIAADLMQRGVNVARLNEKLFKSRTLGQLGLFKCALNNMKYYYKNKVCITYLTKTNFVDNSWFLVNQRGVTAFNGSNQPLATVGTYIYDRWVVLEDEGNQNRSILTNEGMLHISAASLSDPTKSFVLGQYINDESWKMLSAKPIIASISYSLDGEVFATRELKTICPIYDSSSYITNQPYQIQLVENSGWGIAIKINEADGKRYLTYCLLWYGNGWNPTTTTDSDVYVNKVKLEVGDDTNTLGYDLPPSYSDELLKCQKYFMYYGGKPAATSQVVFLGQGIADTSTKIDWAVPINQPMISTPHIAASVSLEGRKGFTSSTNAFTIASDALANSTIFEGINSLYVTTTITGATAGSAYIINLPATATVDEGATETISYISFSAEPVPTIPTTGS